VIVEGEKMLIRQIQDLKREVLRLKEELERLKAELLTARIKELRQTVH
jgi:phage host-nuclease inhibitor protein Gam